MNSSKQYDENEMAVAFQTGLEEGFDYFFRQLYPVLCLYANRILNDQAEAEDIASGAFIKIWNRHTQFNQAGNIRSYLYRIVRNDCLKHLQKRNKSRKVEADLIYLNSSDVHHDEMPELISAEFMRKLSDALNDLPAQCSKVFKKLYVEGKSTKEAAVELHMSIGNVKTQKARGLASLRKKFISLPSIFSLFLL